MRNIHKTFIDANGDVRRRLITPWEFYFNDKRCDMNYTEEVCESCDEDLGDEEIYMDFEFSSKEQELAANYEKQVAWAKQCAQESGATVQNFGYGYFWQCRIGGRVQMSKPMRNADLAWLDIHEVLENKDGTWKKKRGAIITTNSIHDAFQDFARQQRDAARELAEIKAAHEIGMSANQIREEIFKRQLAERRRNEEINELMSELRI